MKSDDRGDFVILPLKQDGPEDIIRVRYCFTCRETFPGDHERIFNHCLANIGTESSSTFLLSI